MLRGRWCREALAPEKGRDPRSGKALPTPSATEQSWTGYFSGVGIGSRKEGTDGDKWSKTTQETSGESRESEANGALRNPYHPPGVTIYIEKNIYMEKTLTDSHIDLSVSLLLDCIGIGDYSATTSTLRVALTAL